MQVPVKVALVCRAHRLLAPVCWVLLNQGHCRTLEANFVYHPGHRLGLVVSNPNTVHKASQHSTGVTHVLGTGSFETALHQDSPSHAMGARQARITQGTFPGLHRLFSAFCTSALSRKHSSFQCRKSFRIPCSDSFSLFSTSECAMSWHVGDEDHIFLAKVTRSPRTTTVCWDNQRYLTGFAARRGNRQAWTACFPSSRGSSHGTRTMRRFDRGHPRSLSNCWKRRRTLSLMPGLERRFANLTHAYACLSVQGNVSTLTGERKSPAAPTRSAQESGIGPQP